MLGYDDLTDRLVLHAGQAPSLSVPYVDDEEDEENGDWRRAGGVSAAIVQAVLKMFPEPASHAAGGRRSRWSESNHTRAPARRHPADGCHPRRPRRARACPAGPEVRRRPASRRARRAALPLVSPPKSQGRGGEEKEEVVDDVLPLRLARRSALGALERAASLPAGVAPSPRDVVELRRRLDIVAWLEAEHAAADASRDDERDED